jgi:hypothetical protein
MGRGRNHSPGGETPGWLKLSLATAAGAVAIGGFGGSAEANVGENHYANELIRDTHEGLIDIASDVRQLVLQQHKSVRTERIKYFKKDGEPNATRIVLTSRDTEFSDKLFDHLSIIIKDGESLPASTAILEGVKRAEYHPGEHYEYGTVLETFPDKGLTWMESMTYLGSQAESKGMYPLPHIPEGYGFPDKETKREYKNFIKDIHQFIAHFTKRD